LAQKKNVTATQLALAWVLAQGDDFFAIPGTKKEKYLLENYGAMNVELSKSTHLFPWSSTLSILFIDAND
jgi:aryl-alcohol dehydrogenase-like predicted oxidoreductase